MNWLTRIIPEKLQKRSRTAKHYRRNGKRLELEVLEDRLMPVIGANAVPAAILAGGPYDGVVLINSAAGSYTLRADYDGDASFNFSYDTLAYEVEQGETVVTVIVPEESVIYGESFTVSATVEADSPSNVTDNRPYLVSPNDPLCPSPAHLLELYVSFSGFPTRVGPVKRGRFSPNMLSLNVQESRPLALPLA